MFLGRENISQLIKPVYDVKISLASPVGAKDLIMAVLLCFTFTNWYPAKIWLFPVKMVYKYDNRQMIYPYSVLFFY